MCLRRRCAVCHSARLPTDAYHRAVCGARSSAAPPASEAVAVRCAHLLPQDGSITRSFSRYNVLLYPCNSIYCWRASARLARAGILHGVRSPITFCSAFTCAGCLSLSCMGRRKRSEDGSTTVCLFCRVCRAVLPLRHRAFPAAGFHCSPFPFLRVLLSLLSRCGAGRGRACFAGFSSWQTQAFAAARHCRRPAGSRIRTAGLVWLVCRMSCCRVAYLYGAWRPAARRAFRAAITYALLRRGCQANSSAFLRASYSSQRLKQTVRERRIAGISDAASLLLLLLRQRAAWPLCG